MSNETTIDLQTSEVYKSQHICQVETTGVNKNQDSCQVETACVNKSQDSCQVETTGVKKGQDSCQVESTGVNKSQDSCQVETTDVNKNQDSCQVETTVVNKNQDNCQVEITGVHKNQDSFQVETTDVNTLHGNCKSENEDLLGGPSFYPPLYIQRYSFVKDIFDKLQPESVVDFGCAECSIFRHLKEVVTLLRISLVDIDTVTLDMSKHRVRPLCYDYLIKRKNLLHVQILSGSATKFDKRLADYDAVSMVEFIEHLYEDDLKDVVKMVFGCINPKFAVMTTPNYEFNELFPGPRRFRHADHKFEWTRPQFETWCKCICEAYKYTCEFYGIGEGPPDSQSVGCCSQAAVLTRKGEKKTYTFDIQEDVYSVIYETTYPCQVSIEKGDLLQTEIAYSLSFMSKCTDYHNEDDELAFIPVDKLLEFKRIKSICDANQLKSFLREQNFNISKNNNAEDCVVVELNTFQTRDIWYGDEEEDYSYNVDDNLDQTSQSAQEINNDTEPEELWD